MSNGDVRAKIAAIQGRKPILSSELQRFLDIAWSNRKQILESGSGSDSKIYKLYGRIEERQGSTGVNNVLSFLRELQARVVNLPGASPHWIQGQDDELTVEEAIVVLETSIEEGATETDEDFSNILRNLGFTFYHFPRDGGVSNARIYLNVRPAFRVEVAAFILGLINRYPKDAHKAKVAGPANFRADGIVIWMQALNQMDNLLREIARYQIAKKAYFDPGIPMLCRQVSSADGVPLIGTGVASEPPEGRGGKVSYGKSRVVPIYESLEAVRRTSPHMAVTKGVMAKTLKTAFIDQVVNRLRAAGIDPANVHV